MFQETAEAHVEAAIAELREVYLLDDPAAHAAFLRREVLTTFLPRYTRSAITMTEREEGGFGLGPVSEPVGRLVLVALALVLFFALLRYLWLPVVWPLMLLVLSSPFWPDLVSTVSRGRYRRSLEGMLSDMTAIQDQAVLYLRPDQLKPEREERPGRRPEPQKETP